METTQISTDQRMDKQNVAYTLNRILLKRNEISTHATTQMNLKNIMLNEIRQTQMNKYYRTVLIWVIWNSEHIESTTGASELKGGNGELFNGNSVCLGWWK